MRPSGLPLLLLIPLAAQGQFHRIAPPQPWVEELPIAGLSVQDTACSRGGTEYLLAERQYHLGEERSYFRLVTRLNTSEAVQNGSRVEVDVDPSYQRLDLHAVRIIRNGQAMDQLGTAHVTVLQRERDLNAFLYDGTRSVVIELRDVRPGDIIDHAYTLQGNDAAGDGRFHRRVSMGHSVPLARHHLRFIVPAGRKLHFKGHRFDEPATERTGAWGREHVWDRRDLPCIMEEGGAPDWHIAYPQIEVSEFKDMEDLRRWAIGQFAVDMRMGNDLQRVVDRLRRLPDPLDRIDSAIHIVQREVRYLGLEEGISAYRPRPPAKVYAQRFGDCKDRSLLLVALLREMGLKAWPALVSTTHGRILGQCLPRPSLFDHCIALIEHGGQRFWVDPTMTHNRGPLAERYTPDMGLALIVDPGASGWEAMRTNETGGMEIHERFTLDDVGGGAVLEVETRFDRREADRIRSWLAGRSITGTTEEYRDFYRRSYGEVTVLDPVRWEDDVAANILTTRERYRLEGIWDTLAAGGFSFNVWPEALKGHVDVPALRTRESPYALSAPLDAVHRITLHMPEPWTVTTASELIEGFGVRYESHTEMEGNDVLLTYRYRSDSTVVWPGDMPAFHAQQQRIMDDMGMNFSHSGGNGDFAFQGRMQVVYGVLLAMLAVFALCIWGVVRAFRS